MALAGIGVDMLEISRMERVIKRRPHFLRRVFTEEERAYCERCTRPAEHYAARFAAREAVLKALGTGFSGGIGLDDVSVTNDASGRPRALLAGRAAEVAAAQGVREIALSISYTRDVAVANAVAVTDEVRPQPDARANAEREMATSFRRAKSVLDELDRAHEAGQLASGAHAAKEGPKQETIAFEGEKDAEPEGPVAEAPAPAVTPALLAEDALPKE